MKRKPLPHPLIYPSSPLLLHPGLNTFESRVAIVEPDDDDPVSLDTDDPLTTPETPAATDNDVPTTEVRRSTRNRIPPLRYWENERPIYGRHREVGAIGEALGNMPVVIGVQRTNGVTYYQSDSDDDYDFYDDLSTVTAAVSESEDDDEDTESLLDETASTTNDVVSLPDVPNYTIARLIREECGPPPNGSSQNVQAKTKKSPITKKKCRATHHVPSCLELLPDLTISDDIQAEHTQKLKNKLSSPNNLSECPICYKISKEMYLVVNCGHRICYGCSKRLKGRCFSCRGLLSREGKVLQKIY